MEETVQRLFDLGIAPSTSRVYRSAQNRYLRFCSQFHLSNLPLNEDTLSLYVAFLSLQGVKHQSVKSYLSALRHMQIEAGGGDPFGPGRFPRLEYILKGLKRNGPPVATSRRLPITPQIMLQLHAVWNQSRDRYDATMLWAACCLGFFGFLRSGEFTVSAESTFDVSRSLTLRDVAVDNHENPSVVSVLITQTACTHFETHEQKRPVSPRSLNLSWTHGVSLMPGGRDAKLSRDEAGLRRRTFHLQGRRASDSCKIGRNASTFDRENQPYQTQMYQLSGDDATEFVRAGKYSGHVHSCIGAASADSRLKQAPLYW